MMIDGSKHSKVSTGEEDKVGKLTSGLGRVHFAAAQSEGSGQSFYIQSLLGRIAELERQNKLKTDEIVFLRHQLDSHSYSIGMTTTLYQRSRSMSLPMTDIKSPVLKRRASLPSQRACTLFCDIVGFTKLNESMDDVRLYNTVNQPLFSAFDVDKKKLGIHFSKINGDGYIATLKASKDEEDRDVIETMVKFATMMYSRVEALNHSILEDGVELPPIKIRVGIKCGDCLEIINSHSLKTVDVFGKNINRASRMESTDEPGCIQMLETDYKQVKDLFKFDDGHMIDIKGLGPCKVYRLQGFSPQRKFSNAGTVNEGILRTPSHESILEGLKSARGTTRSDLKKSL